MVPEHLLLPAAVAARLADAITYFVSRTAILLYPIPAADGSVTPGAVRSTSSGIATTWTEATSRSC